MINCFLLSCYDEPVNIYYYATYKRSFLNLESKKNENKNNEVLFYQKDIYCVHLRRSTYEKYINDCDVFHNELTQNQLKLHKNEMVGELNLTKVIVLDKYPSVAEDNEEIDAYKYIQENAISYEWKGNSGVMWTKWCGDNAPLLNQI